MTRWPRDYIGDTFDYQFYRIKINNCVKNRNKKIIIPVNYLFLLIISIYFAWNYDTCMTYLIIFYCLIIFLLSNVLKNIKKKFEIVNQNHGIHWKIIGTETFNYKY